MHIFPEGEPIERACSLQRQCGKCGLKGHNSRNCAPELVQFAKQVSNKMVGGGSHVLRPPTTTSPDQKEALNGPAQ